jgi:hypothetical protein
MKKYLIKGLNFYSEYKFKASERLKKPDHSTTYFEGGLGSQILAYIEFINRRNNSSQFTFTETSYFDVNQVFNQENGVTHWQWRLNEYGVELEEMRKFSKYNSKRISKLRRPNGNEYSEYIKKHNLWSPTKNVLEELPIKSSKEYREKVFFSGRRIFDYGVVHIRKGDYLNVASKLIDIDDIEKIMIKLKLSLPKNLVIVSDGIITTSERKKLNSAYSVFTLSKIEYYDKSNSNIDETLVHDLMRSANFLLTSNSTFSFTAGLLNNVDNRLVVFPSSFYGGSDIVSDSLYQTHSKYCIM